MRGGALKAIGSLVPDITSPETLDTLCEFDYISGHGVTASKTYMIVPENTFILFIGPAGYKIKAINVKSKLISGKGANNPRASYMNTMYNEFVKGESPDSSIRPYLDAYVYTPGDILHDTTISFINYTDDTFFRTGIYPLPASSWEELIDDIHIIPFVIKKVKENPALEKIINKAGIKPDIKIFWDELFAIDDYVTLIDRYKQLSLRFLIDWFDNPELIFKTIILKNASDASYGNKLKGKAKYNLSTILKEFPSQKKYHFFLVGTCRQPDIGSMIHYTPAPLESLSYPLNVITNSHKPRSLVRRGSFSVKGEDVVCPIGPGIRPMNLSPLKRALEEHFQSGIILEGKEAELVKYLIRYLFEIIQDANSGAAGGVSEKRLTYAPTVDIKRLAIILNALYFDYPLLKGRNSPAKSEFEKILFITRAIFENYILGIRKNIGTSNTIAKQLLTGMEINTGIRGSKNTNEQITRTLDRILSEKESQLVGKRAAAAEATRLAAEAAEATRLAAAKKQRIKNIISDKFVVPYIEKLSNSIQNMEKYKAEGKFTLPDTSALQIAPFVGKQPVSPREYRVSIDKLGEHLTFLHTIMMESYNITSKIYSVIRFIDSEFTGPYEDLELMLNSMRIETDIKEDIKNTYKPADEIMVTYTGAEKLRKSIETLRKTIESLQAQDKELITKYGNELRVLESKQYAAKPPAAPTPVKMPHTAAAAPPPQKKPPTWVIKMREKQSAKTQKGGRRRLRNITRRQRRKN